MTRISVLMYHKVSRCFEIGITVVKPSRFKDHVALIASDGRPVIKAQEIVNATEDSIVITFDDGYQCIYENALPVMLDAGLTATVFPIVDHVGRKSCWDFNGRITPFQHLSWQQLREFVSLGFEVGSHTLTHRDLTRLTEQELRHEIRASKFTLEDKLGCEVTAISYPFGRFNRRVLDEVIQAGYLVGFTNKPAKAGSLLAIGRAGVYSVDGKASVLAKLNPGRRQIIENFKCTLIAGLSLGTALLKF